MNSSISSPVIFSSHQASSSTAPEFNAGGTDSLASRNQTALLSKPLEIRTMTADETADDTPAYQIGACKINAYIEALSREISALEKALAFDSSDLEAKNRLEKSLFELKNAVQTKLDLQKQLTPCNDHKISPLFHFFALKESAYQSTLDHHANLFVEDAIKKLRDAGDDETAKRQVKKRLIQETTSSSSIKLANSSTIISQGKENMIDARVLALTQRTPEELNLLQKIDNPIWIKMIQSAKQVQVFKKLAQGVLNRAFYLECNKATGNLERARQLLLAGAEIDTLDALNEKSPQKTALHWATFYGKVDWVECFLRMGANPDLEDGDGCTPLGLALLQGPNPNALTIAKLLLCSITHQESDWNLNEQDEEGNTLMHDAAKNGRFNVIKSLIALGARSDIKNNDGETPLGYLS